MISTGMVLDARDENVVPVFPRSPVPGGVERVDDVYPTPIIGSKPIEMSFPDAMREVMNGKRITRLAWETNTEFGEFHDDFLSIFIKGSYHRWMVNSGDLFATDWITLPEQSEDIKDEPN